MPETRDAFGEMLGVSGDDRHHDGDDEGGGATLNWRFPESRFPGRFSSPSTPAPNSIDEHAPANKTRTRLNLAKCRLRFARAWPGIKKTNTKPELAVRRVAHQLVYLFRFLP